ncbi:ORF62 [Ranid herpesvirus 1]|uniref:ORF62 n=1 Tax=Ranid herpesvirus 1 TaxID=85655 RepID=Q14VP6_9VIRU|nr:ORF62 [Ranid herpesvirus 1]ABG25780.1 ORF62 [Ranid herpesvirus 1]
MTGDVIRFRTGHCSLVGFPRLLMPHETMAQKCFALNPEDPQSIIITERSSCALCKQSNPYNAHKLARNRPALALTHQRCVSLLDTVTYRYLHTLREHTEVYNGLPRTTRTGFALPEVTHLPGELLEELLAKADDVVWSPKRISVIFEDFADERRAPVETAKRPASPHDAVCDQWKPRKRVRTEPSSSPLELPCTERDAIVQGVQKAVRAEQCDIGAQCAVDRSGARPVFVRAHAAPRDTAAPASPPPGACYTKDRISTWY